MSSYAADAAARRGLNLEYLKFRQSISSLGKPSAIIVSSTIKLDNVEVLKVSESSQM
jgi:hypothetical protein